MIDDLYPFYSYGFTFWAFWPWVMFLSTLIDLPLAVLVSGYSGFYGFIGALLMGGWTQIALVIVPWVFTFDDLANQIYYLVSLANNNEGQMNEYLVSQIRIAYGEELEGYQYTTEEDLDSYTGLAKLNTGLWSILWIIQALMGSTIGAFFYLIAGNTVHSALTIAAEDGGTTISLIAIGVVSGLSFLWALVNQIFVSSLNNSMEETFETFVQIWPYENVSP